MLAIENYVNLPSPPYLEHQDYSPTVNLPNLTREKLRPIHEGILVKLVWDIFGQS